MSHMSINIFKIRWVVKNINPIEYIFRKSWFPRSKYDQNILKNKLVHKCAVSTILFFPHFHRTVS